MKFIVSQNRQFWWPVLVVMPSQTVAGETEEQSFEALFEAIGHDEAKALDEERTKAASVNDVISTEIAMLQRVVKGWRGVVGGDEAELAFSDEAFRAAINFTWTRKALYRAYAEAMSGEAARIKN